MQNSDISLNNSGDEPNMASVAEKNKSKRITTKELASKVDTLLNLSKANTMTYASKFSLIINKQNLKAGLFKLEKMFAENKIKESKKKDILEDVLDEELLTWYIDNKNEPITYNEIIQLLKNNFLVKFSYSEYISKKINKEETIEQYIANMFIIGQSLSESNDKILQVVKNNLPFKYKKELALHLTKTKQDLIEIAKIIEQSSNYEYNVNNNRKWNTSSENFINKQNINNYKDRKVGMKTFSLKSECPYVEIVIDDNVYNCLLDTGCTYNIISSSLAKNIEMTRRENSIMSGLSIDGRTIDCLGEGMINFLFDGKQYSEKFYIIDMKTENECDFILGYKWIKSNKVNVFYYVEKFQIETKFNDIFNNVNYAGIKNLNIDLSLNTKNAYIYETVRRIPYNIQEKVHNEIKKLLTIGYIKESESKWNNPLQPILKKNGSIRLTIDCRKLNNIIDVDNYNLPRIDDIINGLFKKKFFSVIDLKDGFHQISISPKDGYKTAFKYKHRTFEWCRLPMGFKNSPIIFQRIMDKILKEEIGVICYVYLDDIVVFGEDEIQHDINLEHILKILSQWNIKINKQKWIYKKEKITFLGYEICNNIFTICKEKGNKIDFIQEPRTRKQLMKLTGFFNYFRKFIPNYSTLSNPLTSLLSNKIKFVWGEKQSIATKEIINIIQNLAHLNIPDHNLEFILYTDASESGLGAILMQNVDGCEKVIEYASRSINKCEQKYGISEKEALALKWGVENFKHYLRGKTFKIKTDHKALMYIKNKECKNARIKRWYDSLMEYNFTVEYVPGSEMNHVDFLSRLDENNTQKINTQSKYFEDKKYGLMIRNTNNQNKIIGSKIVLHNNKYYYIKKRTLIEIPPVELRYNIIKEEHEKSCHRGIQTMYENIKEKWYWPGILKSIKNFYKKCNKCKTYNAENSKFYRHVDSTFPFEIIGMDIVEPKKNLYIVTIIDYFTRIGYAKKIKSKAGQEILKILYKYCSLYGKPTKIVTDNGKEFLNHEFEKFCNDQEIIHHKTSSYRHESNGRIERFNRTILEMILKGTGKFSSKLKQAILSYNKNFHSSILMSPFDALRRINQENYDMLKNLNQNKNYKQKCKTPKEKYIIGEQVLLRNYNRRNKTEAKYVGPGVVEKELENDCYLVGYKKRKIKRSWDQLRKYYDDTDFVFFDGEGC